MDYFEQFIRTECILDQTQKEKSSTLYKEYVKYIIKRGVQKIISNKRFTLLVKQAIRTMTEHEIYSKIKIVETGHGTNYVGLCLVKNHVQYKFNADALKVSNKYDHIMSVLLSLNADDFEFMKRNNCFHYSFDDKGVIDLDDSLELSRVLFEYKKSLSDKDIVQSNTAKNDYHAKMNDLSITNIVNSFECSGTNNVNNSSELRNDHNESENIQVESLEQSNILRSDQASFEDVGDKILDSIAIKSSSNISKTNEFVANKQPNNPKKK